MMQTNTSSEAVAAHQPLGDRLTIRGRLMLLGWPSVAVWSMAHGYPKTSVDAVIGTWGPRTGDRVPHGRISAAVVRDLRRTMQEGIRPKDVPAFEKVAKGEMQ